MKLIIAGSRTIDIPMEKLDDYITQFVYKHLAIGEDFEVVAGEARGIDTCAKRYAKLNGIPYHSFPANWELHGKSAGPKRNKEMAKFADALLLVWDGQSKGSRHMKDIMTKMNKPIYEVIIENPDLEEQMCLNGYCPEGTW